MIPIFLLVRINIKEMVHAKKKSINIVSAFFSPRLHHLALSYLLYTNTWRLWDLCFAFLVSRMIFLCKCHFKIFNTPIKLTSGSSSDCSNCFENDQRVRYAFVAYVVCWNLLVKSGVAIVSSIWSGWNTYEYTTLHSESFVALS